MAIVKMNKFNLLSFEKNRANLLDILQNFNYVHFNDLYIEDDENYISEVKNSETIGKIDEDISKLSYLIENIEKYGRNYKKDGQKDNSIKNLSIDKLNELASKVDFSKIYLEIKDFLDKREKLITSNQNLISHINEIEPWKDIDLDLNDLYKSERFFIQTGMIPKSYYENFKKNLLEANIESALVREVSQKDSNVYVFVLSSKEERDRYLEFLRENGFSKIRINESGAIKDNLASLKKEKEANDAKIQDLEEKIASYYDKIYDLELYNAYLVNLRKKEESSEFFLKTKKLDFIEGYIPFDMVEKFKNDLDKALASDKFALEIKEADKEDENVPIILRNNKLIQPFEQVVDTYALPKYSELDPTPLIAPFYAIYTGFMIGDLGYGLLGILGCLFAKRKKNLSKDAKKMVNLILWMSASASVFGLIFGSVFGGIIPMPALINTQKDFNSLITLSFIIGFVAMFFALGIKGYMLIRDGKALDAVFDVLLWYFAIAGAIGFLGNNILPFIPKNLAKWTMIIGMLGIVLTSGRKQKSLGAKAAVGLYDLYGMSSWIGDFVSFLRLMALVLSGGFVAYAVNLIVGMITSSGGVLAFIGGSIIFIFFQLFNMFLSYLSGYVHSLRLVYVEMFNKFYEGGGKRFREMVEDTKFININRGGKDE